jgi:hypothetical protein
MSMFTIIIIIIIIIIISVAATVHRSSFPCSQFVGSVCFGDGKRKRKTRRGKEVKWKRGARLWCTVVGSFWVCTGRVCTGRGRLLKRKEIQRCRVATLPTRKFTQGSTTGRAFFKVSLERLRTTKGGNPLHMEYTDRTHHESERSVTLHRACLGQWTPGVRREK